MTYLIQGRTNDWEVVIGLEVHAQIISDAKLFSGAATSFGAEPNFSGRCGNAGYVASNKRILHPTGSTYGSRT